MKKINPLLPIIILILTFLNSCVSGYHIGTGDKMNNLTHWKQDRLDKNEAKKDKQLKDNLTKN